MDECKRAEGALTELQDRLADVKGEWEPDDINAQHRWGYANRLSQAGVEAFCLGRHDEVIELVERATRILEGN